MAIHKQVEYHVSAGKDAQTSVYPSIETANKHVMALLMTRGEARLDVCIWSVAGARAYGGDAAVEQYKEDPDASVFERFEFKGNCVGRVP